MSSITCLTACIDSSDTLQPRTTKSRSEEKAKIQNQLHSLSKQLHIHNKDGHSSLSNIGTVSFQANFRLRSIRVKNTECWCGFCDIWRTGSQVQYNYPLFDMIVHRRLNNLLEEQTLVSTPPPPLTAYAFYARVIGEWSLCFLDPCRNGSLVPSVTISAVSSLRTQHKENIQARPPNFKSNTQIFRPPRHKHSKRNISYSSPIKPNIY